MAHGYILTVGDLSMPLRTWAEWVGADPNTIIHRLYRGWCDKAAIFGKRFQPKLPRRETLLIDGVERAVEDLVETTGMKRSTLLRRVRGLGL